MKLSRPSSIALAILAAALPACGGAPPEKSPPAMPAPASERPAESKAGVALFPAGGGNEDVATPGEDLSTPKPPPLTPLGVPECDRFVERYVACVDVHAPEDQRERLMRELHTHRVRWLELEKMQEGKIAAGLACRGVAQRLKGDLIVDYGCEF